MKIFTISLLLFIASLLCANELSWVDEQVEAIKPARPGIDNSIISAIEDPFIFLEKNGYKKTKKQQKKRVLIKTAPKKKTVKKTN